MTERLCVNCKWVHRSGVDPEQGYCKHPRMVDAMFDGFPIWTVPLFEGTTCGANCAGFAPKEKTK